jgi:hypothetical protein
MILYHGSNTEIEQVDLSKCRPYKDFGRGFYTTVVKEQSWRMALRTAKRYGGGPCVTVFSIVNEVFSRSGLKIRIFENPTEQWAQFVINNRYPKLGDIHGSECNTDNKYDIVQGPVANDDLNFIFNQYVTGLVPMEYLAAQMKEKKLTDQISFHTVNAVRELQKTGSFYD